MLPLFLESNTKLIKVFGARSFYLGDINLSTDVRNRFDYSQAILSLDNSDKCIQFIKAGG